MKYRMAFVYCVSNNHKIDRPKSFFVAAGTVVSFTSMERKGLLLFVLLHLQFYV
jgi:hypothetical protein